MAPPGEGAATGEIIAGRVFLSREGLFPGFWTNPNFIRIAVLCAQQLHPELASAKIPRERFAGFIHVHGAMPSRTEVLGRGAWHHERE